MQKSDDMMLYLNNKSASHLLTQYIYMFKSSQSALELTKHVPLRTLPVSLSLLFIPAMSQEPSIEHRLHPGLSIIPFHLLHANRDPFNRTQDLWAPLVDQPHASIKTSKTS